jgi:hypothetical protein
LVFFETFGVTIVFASLAVKLFRIYKIFVGNTSLRYAAMFRTAVEFIIRDFRPLLSLSTNELLYE